MQKESKLYLGDCLEIMPQFETDSIDAIITDPPYGISFMGKDWDKAVPSIAIWKECLRVLKPGAFAFVMSIPRQDCLARMICRLEDAGFNVAFSSIYHTFATGFPKAQNLSKAADKHGGVSISWFGKWLKEWRTKNNISQKEIAKLFPSKTGGLTGCVANWELGLNMPTPTQFTKICRHFDLPFESIEEAKREVIGKARYETLKEVPMPGANCSKENRILRDVTVPFTSQAKALEGAYSGFQPKPAVEVVIVAMKSIEEKTYIDQALKNGHGCTWLDECRIPYESDPDKNYREKDVAHRIENNIPATTSNINNGVGAFVNANNKGRFPANVLCEDDVLDDGVERKSGAVLTHHKRSGASDLGKTFKIRDRTGEFADWKSNSGGYSRYFSLDAWFAERIKQLPKEAQKTFPWLIVPKASKREKDRGLKDLEYKKGTDIMASAEWQKERSRNPDNYKGNKNNHPTTKPLKLMNWLIILSSREGDIILDPFMGSGTTPLAAKMTHRHYKGIEREKEFFNISVKRIDEAQQNMDKFL